jgi:hypothetical protein
LRAVGGLAGAGDVGELLRVLAFDGEQPAALHRQAADAEGCSLADEREREQAGDIVEDEWRRHRGPAGVHERRHAHRGDRSRSGDDWRVRQAIVAFDAKTLHVKDWFTSSTVDRRRRSSSGTTTRTSSPRRRGTDASCCSTPRRLAERITRRRPTRRSRSPRRHASRQKRWRCGDAAGRQRLRRGAAVGSAGALPTEAQLHLLQRQCRRHEWLWFVAGAPAQRRGLLTGGPITNGAIVALKIVDNGGKPSCNRAGSPRHDLGHATHRQGVVFGLSKARRRPFMR